MSEESIIINLIDAVRDLTDSVTELQQAAREYTGAMYNLNKVIQERFIKLDS